MAPRKREGSMSTNTPAEDESRKKKKLYGSAFRLTPEARELALRAAMLQGISVSEFINNLILDNTLDMAIQDSEDFLRRARKTRDQEPPRRGSSKGTK